MPIDSAGKRRSVSGVAGVPLLPGVTPDAAEPVAWRQQAAWSYSGIAAYSAEPAPAEVTFVVPPVTRTFAAAPLSRTFTAPPITRTFTVVDPE
jgi:hypothetical protein